VADLELEVLPVACERRRAAVRAHVRATIPDIAPEFYVKYYRGRGDVADSPYWNPKTETLDRERLDALQLAKLRYQCEWAAERSPWYRRQFAASGFSPGSLRSLDDLRRIPVLHRDDWMASQEAAPPYGELPVIGGEGAIRVHTTSGTTGRGPLRALDSRKDWAWIAEMWAYAIWGCGARPTDVAYIAFGYGSF